MDSESCSPEATNKTLRDAASARLSSGKHCQGFFLQGLGSKVSCFVFMAWGLEFQVLGVGAKGLQLLCLGVTTLLRTGVAGMQYFLPLNSLNIDPSTLSSL